MAITINAVLQDLAGDAVAESLETSGTINLYGGTPPASAKAAQSNDAIATGTMPAIGDHDGNNGAEIAATLEIVGVTAAGAGTNATHFRISNGGGVLQGTVGAASSGADMELVNVNIADTQEVNVTSLNILMPDGTA